MKSLIVLCAATIFIVGCSGPKRIDPKFPKPVKPSSANIAPKQLTEEQVELCLSSKVGRKLCRAFLVNRARHGQSNNWINRTHDKWAE